MKYKTRQLRNLSFRQIVKRKNKKTRKQRKQRKLSFRQIVERKNKRTRTRKQQHGGVIPEAVVGLATLGSIIAMVCLMIAFGYFFQEIYDIFKYINEKWDEATGMFNKSVGQQAGAVDELAVEEKANAIVDQTATELAKAVLDANPENRDIVAIAEEAIINNSKNNLEPELDSHDEFVQMMHKMNIQINHIQLYKSIMPKYFYKLILGRSLRNVLKECPDSDIINIVEVFYNFFTTYNTKDKNKEQLSKIEELNKKIKSCNFVQRKDIITELNEAITREQSPEELLEQLKDISSDGPVKNKLGSRFSRFSRYLRIPQVSSFRNPFRLMKRENISKMFRSKAATTEAFSAISEELTRE